MSTLPPSYLQIQGRWCWIALPFVALASAAFLWINSRAIAEADYLARYHLLRNAPGWSLTHAFTGRTVGR